ncbi:VIT and vWA domain-containing protein [Candidatus Clostridium stratigraminis]|uniref:VIT and vWA domain-containing protein n=1 Tax=Candidatus Clostridium stratigraminis TaxID=3381661 RepID=A0ABW8T230_9CLOT
MVGYGLKSNKSMLGDISLKEVGISGNICGEYVEVSIKQVYENKGRDNIDGLYTFPIPDTAVITGFEAALGGRTLKAIVEEKEEAKRIYEESDESNVNTLILEEPYPNVYQFTIGQILPGESVKIKFSYMDMLVYEDESLILTIPSILYPTHVNDSVNIQDELYGDIYKTSLNILIEPLSKTKIESPSHKINVEWEEDNNLAKVTFSEKNVKLDEDLVLLLTEEKLDEASGMIYKYMDEDDKGILYLRVFPRLQSLEEEKPNDYIFLADISHSMKGAKLDEAKNALQLCIRNLSEGDSFNIVAFESKLHYFSELGKVPFNEENLKKATVWINNLQERKGAAIFEALKYALTEESNAGFSTILLFTDDIIENEDQVLHYVKENIGDNRIFTFGIDTSANSYVINKLAQLGYGKAEFIYEGERIEDMILKQFSRIENPQVDIQEINWGSMKVERTYPRSIDYFYDREPLSIFAKVAGEIEGKITIKGKVDNKDYIKTIDLDSLDLNENVDLIQKIWSRKRIDSIEERMKTERGETLELMRNKVVEISKEFGIISPETSFMMHEIIEEPVLGMPLTHIVPLKISEEISKNISRANFLDVPTFVYKQTGMPSTDEIKEKGDNAILDYKYPRPTILRTLAKNQYADGSFCDEDKNNMYNRLKTTALVLLAFTSGKDDITMYANLLSKSVRFLFNSIEANEKLYDSKLSLITIFALKSSIAKGLLKDNLIEKGHAIFEKLKENIDLTAGEGILNLVNYSGRVVLKEVSPYIFNFSKDDNCIKERLIIGKEENSIEALAKLGILKSSNIK